jgi:hypothetical protein
VARVQGQYTIHYGVKESNSIQFNVRAGLTALDNYEYHSDDDDDDDDHHHHHHHHHDHDVKAKAVM